MDNSERLVFEEYLNYIRTELPSWADLEFESVEFQILTGTSNKVYKVFNTYDVQPNPILFRIFGPNEVTDKVREHKIFQYLAEHNLAPKILAYSSKIRIEEFLDGYLPIEYADLHNPEIIQKICDKAKEIHELKIPLPNEENILLENLTKWRKNSMQKIELIENLGKQEKIADLLSDHTWTRFLKILPRRRPECFLHLDMNFFNILLNRNTGGLFFVDFEFSGYGDRSIDFANLFSDMRFDYLYNQPPYFAYDKEKAPSDELIVQYVKAYGESQNFWVDIKQSFIVINYIWAVWGVAMWKPYQTGFDYLENALLRYSEFIQESENYFSSGEQNYLEKLSQILFNNH